MVEFTPSHIKLNVNDCQQNNRLDSWLSQKLSHLSRSRIQKLIANGHVLINNQICNRKQTKLKNGDQLIINFPEVQPSHLQPEAIPLEILYEDEQLIIINKPAGLVVHPAPGHYSGTLVHALLAYCPNLQGIGGIERPGIVHRLDKDTTGAIVVAKTEIALRDLQAQLKAKTARRNYLGIVYGSPQDESGTINLPIGRHRVERKKMAVVPPSQGGREATTHWQVQERLGNYSLLHFALETGRTHQIRVHTSYIGHPLVGDATYSSNRSIGVNLTGQALHAYQLSLTHPLSQQLIQATAPFPSEFNKLLRVLRNKL